MRIVLATLCLNEMEWLPKLYEQHKYWPGLVKWVFVEAADRVYAEINPDLVSKDGLSVDGTTEFLKELAAIDENVTHIPFGVSTHDQIAQGKCAARNKYLEAADQLEPDFVFVVDADEFYTFDAQQLISTLLQDFKGYSAFRFRQREIWRPPSVSGKPLFNFEVKGGFWDIFHVRGWQWMKGMRYVRNHNWPEHNGYYLTERTAGFENDPAAPQCVHLAFASSKTNRVAKNRYYEARGEGQRDRRQLYVDSRQAWVTWEPGKRLPGDARVVHYHGPIPEVLGVL